jgi:hypothetical protein
MGCAVEGCERPGEGQVRRYNHADLRLCQEHGQDFDLAPHLWDGELSTGGDVVERIWPRQGVGDAS